MNPKSFLLSISAHSSAKTASIHNTSTSVSMSECSVKPIQTAQFKNLFIETLQKNEEELAIKVNLKLPDALHSITAEDNLRRQTKQ